MFSKDRKLVIFSIVSSVLSASLGFIQRFMESLSEVDIKIIFFSGIIVFLVLITLLYLLAKQLIGKVREHRIEKLKRKRKKRR